MKDSPISRMQVGQLPALMTQDKINELREAFDLFDLDHDGRITSVELQTVMIKLRQSATKEDIDDMIRNVDVDGNGTIEFEEFLAAMTIHLANKAAASEEAKRQREEFEAHQAFKIFDIDGDGLIDSTELRQTMQNLGEELSDLDVQAMILAADKNGDGKIDFQDDAQLQHKKSNRNKKTISSFKPTYSSSSSLITS